MVAVPVNPPPLSGIEGLVAWRARAARRKADREGRPVRPSTVAWWVSELWGTVTAFAAFTIGAFLHLPPIAGWMVLGLCLLLVHTQISGARRRRAAASAGDAGTQQSPPVELAPRRVEYR